MSEWKEYYLPELGKLARGKSKHRPRWASHLYDGKYPFIQTGEITAVNKYINSYQQTYSDAGLAQSKLWPENTLCITIAANIAEIGILKFPACFPDSVLGFIPNPDKADLDFIFYTLTYFKNRIKALAIGSVQDNISLGTFEHIQFKIPPIEEQKQIADILSCLDNKIDNLRRQNETLETIAQTLFKHWFIDFEFPNDEGKPYKSSGGAMVASELGDIPTGWCVGKLDECLSLVIDYRGKTPKKLGMEWSTKGIPALSAKNIKDGKIVREDSLNYGSKELYKLWMKDELQKGDILLTSEAPLGEVYYLANNKKYILSQRLFALRTNCLMTSTFLYCWLTTEQGKSLLKRRETGSTVTGIRQVELREVEIIIPPQNLVLRITDLLNSILIRINANHEQIQTLTKTRDTLLPKLMSGQIRVKEGESIIEEE